MAGGDGFASFFVVKGFIKLVPYFRTKVFPLLIFFSFLVLPCFSFAGDVWVFPGKFDALSRGDILPIQVGKGQVFPESLERVITNKLKVRIYSSSGSDYLVPLKPEEKSWSGEFTVKRDGAHLIVADIERDFWTKTGDKWVNLPKIKVPAYEQSIAFWYLSKAIPSSREDTSLYLKNLGYPFEIIPLDNPALIKPEGGKLRLKVLFEGNPEFGVPVEITYMGFSKNPEIKVASVHTDQNGIAEIFVRKPGIWYISARKYLRDLKNKLYETEAYQSNLIFQITPPKPAE